MVIYTDNLDDIKPDQLNGFFVGWLSPPTNEKHFEILKGSSHVILALLEDRVVGFINAISDGILSAYIPLLEVLPEYQNQGIGKELVRRILHKLEGFYMIDLTCDTDLQNFYKKFDMKQSIGMMMRNYSALSGN